jgi:hypothetical protein
MVAYTMDRMPTRCYSVSLSWLNRFSCSPFQSSFMESGFPKSKKKRKLENSETFSYNIGWMVLMAHNITQLIDIIMNNRHLLKNYLY